MIKVGEYLSGLWIGFKYLWNYLTVPDYKFGEDMFASKHSISNYSVYHLVVLVTLSCWWGQFSELLGQHLVEIVAYWLSVSVACSSTRCLVMSDVLMMCWKITSKVVDYSDMSFRFFLKIKLYFIFSSNDKWEYRDG